MRRESGTTAALAALAVATAALACGRQEPAPERGPPAQAAAPAPEAPAAAAPRAGPARGDRHARAAARKRSGVRQLSGVIARVDEGRVAIRPRGGEPVTLHVGRATAITVDGRRRGTDALRAGADVRASYRSGDGAPATALTIEARGDGPAARPEPPAATPPRGEPAAAPDAVPPSDG